MSLSDSETPAPIERSMTERFFVNPNAHEYEAERREQALVRSLDEFLRARGHDVCRLKIVPLGESRPIFCDVLDRTAKMLVEAKGTVTRIAIRMAIGQLMDYRTFPDEELALAVLVPERPRNDLLDLLKCSNIQAIWPEDGGFRTSRDSDTDRPRLT